MSEFILGSLDLSPYIARMKHRYFMSFAVELAYHRMEHDFWQELHDLCLLGDGKFKEFSNGPRLCILPLFIGYQPSTSFESPFTALYTVKIDYPNAMLLHISIIEQIKLPHSLHLGNLCPIIFSRELLDEIYAHPYTSKGRVYE